MTPEADTLYAAKLIAHATMADAVMMPGQAGVNIGHMACRPMIVAVDCGADVRYLFISCCHQMVSP